MRAQSEESREETKAVVRKFESSNPRAKKYKGAIFRGCKI
jgi:hypothetical protein